MSQLQIQIVDKDDNPLGGASIPEARQEGLYHQIVRVVLEDYEGRLLLQKRSALMHDFPNCWDSTSAGHVDAGETYEIAAKRELFEEIGLQDVVLKEIEYKKVERSSGAEIINRFEKVYIGKIEHTHKFILQPEEVSEVRWFDLSEVKQMMNDTPEVIAFGLREIIRLHYS